ncbi:hypothetical protein WJX73_000678 [Symbiochloris irregularis]|uniref:START domain-containing protein n=1 Tax=Symbiochloris irregularis TaxID=706552 RepID=A0AAW1NLJ7_9CHLO
MAGIFGGSLQWWEQIPVHQDLGLLLVTVLPVWIFGALIGLLLPRPKWLEAGASGSSILLASPAGLFVRRATIAYHAAYICREIWRFFTAPETLQTVLAAPKTLFSAEGLKQRQHKRHSHRRHRTRSGRASLEKSRELGAAEDAPVDWYVTEEDLEFFKDRVEREVELPGSGPWEHMMDKNFSELKYSAWRRRLADGKTDYKSLTVSDNATAEEFMDFYLDDDSRSVWDPMITEHQLLENGPGKHRCQVVRWIRTFPFSFIKSREYVIARRVWRQDGALYGITKVIDHPRAVRNPNIVHMDAFYSMWRCRTIPTPSGRPACETILLHREDFKIPERLSRFAVQHGMAGFIKKVSAGVTGFVEQRRTRADMFAEDAQAYGLNAPINPPSTSGNDLARTYSTNSLVSSRGSGLGDEESEDGSSECSTPRYRGSRGRRRRRENKLLRKFGWALAATWAAVVVNQ